MSTHPPPNVAGWWTALIPLTYAVHIAEEYWVGETFYGWVSRVASVNISREEFVALNAVAMVVMIAGVVAANVTSSRLPIAALGTVIALNGALHAAGSIVTSSYSPGVISGVLLWIPLGAYALRTTFRALPRAEFAGGVVAGILAHALVSAIAFNS